MQSLPSSTPTRGGYDDEFVYVTRRIRLRRSDIEAVQQAHDGEGSIVTTSRSTMRVLEDFRPLANVIFGNAQKGGAK